MGDHGSPEVEWLVVGEWAYPRIAVAGKYLALNSDNGLTLILEPGREYGRIVGSALEMLRNSPVYRGKRIESVRWRR